MTTELITVARLEELVLPDTLDGSSGTNRAFQKTCQIKAHNDIEAINAWLLEYADKLSTHRNYRKDAERLLLWAIVEQRKPLSSLDGEDLVLYSKFLDNPQPREKWCGAKLAIKGKRWTKEWRPFVSGLSQPAKVTTFANLNSLFNYLVGVQYLAHNPLFTVRRQIKHHAPIAEYKWQVAKRIIDFEEWAVFREMMEALPENTLDKVQEKTRLKFLIALLYFGALRISELTNNAMNAFKKTYDYQACKERWWLDIVGKGGKRRKIPVNQQLLQALIDYRRVQNLPDLPEPYETEPLIKSPLTKKGISSRRVNQLIKEVGNKTAQYFEKDQPEKAKRLRKFSAHWLRHLSVSMQGLAQIDKQIIKENVGHKSLQTTEVYLHTFENYQHEQMERHQWEPATSKLVKNMVLVD